LPIFADEFDAPHLVDWLNGEEDIAFIVSDGPQRWKAVRKVSGIKNGRHALWHVPSGPLPRVKKYGDTEPIANPWRGWKERHPGRDSTTPWFGGVCTSVFNLELNTIWPPDWVRVNPESVAAFVVMRLDSSASEEEADLETVWDTPTGSDEPILGLSHFDWLGNHYRLIGYGASPLGIQWWKRLRRWVARSSTRLQAGRFSFWAFPSALEKLKSEMQYYANGFDLSEALRRVRR
jgi:hypothetical protein